ncbi:pentatricopeptide repeat-containing protein [Tanacetum coccineum]
MDQNNLNDFDPTDTYDHYDAFFQPDYDRYMRDYESYQHYVGLCEQEAGGSSDGPKRRRTYIFREREEAEQRLIDDYFGDDEYEPKYPEEKFRRRYFRVRIDAIGRNSIGPILKCTSAIRQMAYGTAPDAFDEYSTCMDEKCVELGLMIHCHVVKNGFMEDGYVKSAGIQMYSSFRRLNEARMILGYGDSDVVCFNALIDGWSERDEISWSAMIDVYNKMWHLGSFRYLSIYARKVKVKKFVLSSVALACANVGSLEQGKWIHDYARRNVIELDGVLGTALLDMYAKLGDVLTLAWCIAT